MERADIRDLLKTMWANAGGSDPNHADPEIDPLVNSSVQSIRYALLTQVLGKIEDPKRDILALQKEGGRDGYDGWDARSFCKDVIVPWTESTRNIIGASTDPYVSNPLRRERLDGDSSTRDKDQWKDLVRFLGRLNDVGNEGPRDALRRILEGVYRMGLRNKVEYHVPEIISFDGLCDMVRSLLEDGSGGYRPQAVCAALMRAIGSAFGIFDEVKVQGINEPDAQSGSFGDITCSKDGGVRLVIEVKDRELKITDYHAGIAKIRGHGICDLLFAAPGMDPADRQIIRSYVEKTLTEDGISICRANVMSLIESTMALMGLGMRLSFIRNVCDELDSNGQYEDRKRWEEACESH